MVEICRVVIFLLLSFSLFLLLAIHRKCITKRKREQIKNDYNEITHLLKTKFQRGIINNKKYIKERTTNSQPKKAKLFLSFSRKPAKSNVLETEYAKHQKTYHNTHH